MINELTGHMELKIDISMLICIVGGILLLLGVLQPWVDVSSIVNSSYSGWDILMNGSDLPFADGFEKYAPLVCIIGALAMFVIGIYLTVYKKSDYKNIMSIVIVVLGVVSVVMVLCFYGSIPTDDISVGAMTFLGYSAGIGLWLSLAGGVVSALGGAYSLKSR